MTQNDMLWRISCDLWLKKLSQEEAS